MLHTVRVFIEYWVFIEQHETNGWNVRANHELKAVAYQW